MDKQLFEKTRAIASKLQQRVDDHELPYAIARASAGANKAYSPIGDVSFSFTGDANVAIYALNASNDSDALSIFGVPESNDAPLGIAWQPMLQAGQGTVWLKYAADCHLKLGAKAPAGLAALSIDSTASLSVATFMPHRARRRVFPSVAEALAGDLEALPHIFSADSVKALQADQAVALELGGSLSLSLTLAWADVLSGLSDPTNGITTGASALALRIGANAKVDFALRLAGAYRIAFRGLPNDLVELQVLSDRKRSTELGISAGLEIAFANPDAAQAVLKELAGELLGGDTQAIDAWKAKIEDLLVQINSAHDDLVALFSKPGDTVARYLQETVLDSKIERIADLNERVQQALADTASEVEAVKSLAETLDLSETKAQSLLTKVQALPSRLTALASDNTSKLWAKLGITSLEEKLAYALEQLQWLESTIARVAHAQVKAGFSYEYSRTDDNAALLSIKLATRNLDASVFDDVYRSALTLDLRRILRLAEEHPAHMRDGLLLGHRITETRRAFGFTLGVDRWQASASWQRVRKVMTLTRERPNVEKQLRHSVLGQRSYVGKGFYYGQSFAGEINFAMPEFRAETARAGNWTVGLDLRWERTYRKLNERDVAELLDYAELWAVVAEQAIPSLQPRMIEAFGKKKIRARCQLVIDPTSFGDRRLSEVLAGNLQDFWVLALAGALPQIESHPERAKLHDRERLYSAATAVYLESRYTSARVLNESGRRELRKRLRDAGASKQLTDWEVKNILSLNDKQHWGSLLYLARVERRFLHEWSTFLSSLQGLSTVSEWPVAKGLENINSTIKVLDQAWDDGYSLRAFGRLMTLLHREAGLVSGITGTLTLETLDKNDNITDVHLVLGNRLEGG